MGLHLCVPMCMCAGMCACHVCDSTNTIRGTRCGGLFTEYALIETTLLGSLTLEPLALLLQHVVV
jgi:hypothetical protein